MQASPPPATPHQGAAPQGSKASPRAISEATPGSIHARGLSKAFGANQALHPIDLDIEPGSLVGLIGPNGSGKSTFMRCLVGLVRPDAGTVTIDGVPLVGDGVLVRKRLTYAPGEMGVYRETKASAQLDWFLRGRDKETKRRAREHASELGLPLDKKVGTYSHGMKRQLIFAAAMAPKVPVRILDEITEGLDPSRRTRVSEALVRDCANGTTILLSSHHFGEVDRVCKRILFMQSGKVLEDTSAAVIHDRAARLVRIDFKSEDAANQFGESLPAAWLAAKNQNGTQLVLELASVDPRPVLKHLGEFSSAPAEVQFGSTTLQDLYKNLYGVEGI